VSSYASGINDAGNVSGYAHMADGSSHAILYTAASGMQDLGAPHSNG
jgi:probable HAF family extracellular repeat protein